MSKTNASVRPCPICEAPAQAPFAPFCSARCKQVDLNRWLSAGYAIPGNPSGDESDGVPHADGEQPADEGPDSGSTRH